MLVDGKRRHGTGSLAVLGGPYQGAAAADLNFIPVSAIDHVEVLTDGAAAQYGTDAIAGVINIILKKNTSGGSITATSGQYMDGGGDTGDISANFGIAPIDHSYFNVTVESRFHGHSDRGNPDPRLYDHDGLANVESPAGTVADGNGGRAGPQFPRIAERQSHFRRRALSPEHPILHGGLRLRQRPVDLTTPAPTATKMGRRSRIIALRIRPRRFGPLVLILKKNCKRTTFKKPLGSPISSMVGTSISRPPTARIWIVSQRRAPPTTL